MPWPQPDTPTRHTPPDNRPAPSNSMTLAPGTNGDELGPATGKVPVKCLDLSGEVVKDHPWQHRRHAGRQRHHGVGRSGFSGGLAWWRGSRTEQGEVAWVRKRAFVVGLASLLLVAGYTPQSCSFPQSMRLLLERPLSNK
jgi:hypothetical protein